MKLIPLILILLSATNFSPAQEQKVRDLLKKQDAIIWVGLDYSMMRMVGNSNAIRVPELLFQDFPARWNELFLDERVELMAETLQTRVLLDLEAVTKRNKELSPSQLDIGDYDTSVADQSHLTSADIAKQVRSYKLQNSQGLGLVFIVDRFVSVWRPEVMRGKVSFPGGIKNCGVVYVVFFDVTTREVISSRRELSGVFTGGSFRNFWFGPIKDIDIGLGRYR